MKLIRNMRPCLVAAATVLTLAGLPAGADPVRLNQGRAELPTSGLVVDLPAKDGRRYDISGSWSLNHDSQVFDTRDVVDEFDASGNLILGTWVQSGYFTAGGCAAVFAAVDLEAPWITKVTQWGESWDVQGGVFNLSGGIGRVPAVKFCRERPDGSALLMHHYLVGQPESIGQAAAMAAAADSGVMAAVSRSYTDSRYVDAKPALRPEVRKRGADAARRVSLVASQMSLDLPEDGYVWLVYDVDGVDQLTRTLPSLPPVTLELVPLDGFSCADLLASFTEYQLPDHRPVNLPSGWVAGNGLDVEGDPELIMCHDHTQGALLVGSFQEQDRDVSYLHPLLAALLKAVEAR